MLKSITALFSLVFLIGVSGCEQAPSPQTQSQADEAEKADQTSQTELKDVVTGDVESIEFTILVDTPIDHPRNQGVLLFLESIESESNGRLKGKFYEGPLDMHGGHADVLKEIRNETVDMALPGLWSLGHVDPNADLTALPMFYGQPLEVTEKLVDGELGKMIAAIFEEKLNVVVPGNWYELGYVHLHTREKRVTALDDLKGLKILPYGRVIADRLQASGAITDIPTPPSYPEIGKLFADGTADGIIQSFKVLDILKFVQSGLTYSVKDFGYSLHYVPICTKGFWSRLPDDLKETFVKAWNAHIPDARAILRKLQEESEMVIEELEKAKGGGIYRPSQEELAEWRNSLMPTQAALVKELKMSPDLVNKAKEMLGL